jgi:hypothetical protein
MIQLAAFDDNPTGSIISKFKINEENHADQRQDVHIENHGIGFGEAIKDQKERLRSDKIQEHHGQIARMSCGEAFVDLRYKAYRGQNAGNESKASRPFHQDFS